MRQLWAVILYGLGSIGASCSAIKSSSVGIVSTSVSSRKPKPEIDSVTLRFALVTAFIIALAANSPTRFLMLTAPNIRIIAAGLVACADGDNSQSVVRCFLAKDFNRYAVEFSQLVGCIFSGIENQFAAERDELERARAPVQPERIANIHCVLNALLRRELAQVAAHQHVLDRGRWRRGSILAGVFMVSSEMKRQLWRRE